jgi:hypothetical protein
MTPPGSMADLTAEEDEELKEIRGAGARRDFSVIFSHSRNVNHLFLGPARFVNVSAVRSYNQQFVDYF